MLFVSEMLCENICSGWRVEKLGRRGTERERMVFLLLFSSKNLALFCSFLLLLFTTLKSLTHSTFKRPQVHYQVEC